ncbi:MAG TPA: helix-turn-helix domain-containing protein [Gemmatimonadales bacterium]|nr:helix-turn-helix domain-containing protein [Gemmatimonadales bacterium]
MTERVLVVTGDETLARAVAGLAEGAELVRERDGPGGLVACEGTRPDVVIWDEEVAGPVAVARLVASGAGVVVVVGRGGVAAGVRALREGAEQFVVRPLDLEHLALVVARAAEARRWRRVATQEPPYRPRTLDDVERDQIERTLRHHGGNRTHAARDLGISRATLINKIRAYALDL